MMGVTHIFTGLLLALPLIHLFPGHDTIFIAAAVAGSVIPDMDLIRGMKHRRTLHYPQYGIVASLLTASVLFVFPSAFSAALALFTVSMTVHAWMDTLSSGLEPRPWEATSNESVYLHKSGRWASPRRIIRYDGAPEDGVLSLLLAAPLLYSYNVWIQRAVIGLLLIGIVYVAVRKRLMEWRLTQRFNDKFLKNTD